MKFATFCALVVCLMIVCAFAPLAQQTATIGVPRLVNFSGTLTDSSGTPLTAITGVTFALYKDQRGGSPLWLETQNVRPNAAGAYGVLLGSTKSGGLPVDMFASGEARWLGVQVEGQPEQPRVLMVAVPYALKAADAETVGGLPPSAFALAVPSNVSNVGGSVSGSGHDNSGGAILPPVGGGGTTNYVPLWTSSTNLGNSNIYQNSSKFVGIGTTSPASTLDVNGAEYVRGQLFLPASGTATPTQGFNSRVQNFTASSYNSNTHSAENHSLQWVAEPLGNNTPSPSATLHLRFFSTGGAQETGYSIGSNGIVTFASGQTFPGTGTITGVAAGTDLTGGGTSGIVTLNLNTSLVPQLNTPNTFTGNQTVNGNVNATGVVTGNSFNIGSNLFAFGSYANANVFLGFSGNSTTTGLENTATGYASLITNTTGSLNTASGNFALSSNTTGYENTADGDNALTQNTTGFGNTAIGLQALEGNTGGDSNTAIGDSALVSSSTGQYNTASGFLSLGNNTNGSYNTANGPYALFNNTTGSYNLGLGYNAGPDATSTNLTNATAIGTNALVSQSNALVLGGTGSWAIKVGIGTRTPTNVFTIAQGAGHAIADSWDTYSSRRWKTNIRPLENALGKIQQLRGVSYDLKATGKHEVGVIAEEVGAVVPEIVTWEKNGKNAQSVDYGRLTALLIEATKQQQALIHRQQKEIKAQQAQIVRLGSQVKAIRASLNQDRPNGSEVRTVKETLPIIHQ